MSRKIIDLTGQKFGRLTVIKLDHSEHGKVYWLCHCICGKDIILTTRKLLYDGTKSCGCLRKEVVRQRMRKDLTGKQFNNWTVLKRDEQTGLWLCECKCGTKRLLKTNYLTAGIIKGCGCQNFAQKTNRKRIFNKKFKKWQEYVKPLFSFEQYCQHLNDYNYQWKWKCVKCGKQFKQHIHSTGINKKLSTVPRCFNCFPLLSGYSKREKQIIEYLKTIYNGQIIQNDRTLIVPKELDIIIPELKIAIQFNGLYWHSSQFNRIDQNYHLNKTIECQKIGYRLIHIFQNEWIDNQQIIKQKLKSIICNNIQSIYARKCIIKQINAKQKDQFLNKHHIQGADKAKVKLGLFYQNELIAVMTFIKSRFNKTYEWQLSRYATSKRVVGGASKLLKYFQNNYKPKNIITYADRRYSIGNLYYKLNFKLDHISKPNYFWTKNTSILTRYQTQKHKLKKLLGDKFNQNLTEQQNMLFNGWNKIFDCGNYVFVRDQIDSNKPISNVLA